ncbi:hypothetical protein QJQ45_028847 [Haematococcus lacustris]|nr:hypothetical protein QJQ45_028847 [Haematococcus lacustris]
MVVNRFRSMAGCSIELPSDNYHNYEKPMKHESQWAPLLYPCFQHFSATDSTVRALTQTQVALHEQRSLYEAMLAQSLAQQAESERQRSSQVGFLSCTALYGSQGKLHYCFTITTLPNLQEDSLRALQARSSEAERLYKVNEQQLRVRLDTLLQQLAELGVEHERLQKQSGDQLQLLQDKAAHMAQACQGLQAECSQLQQQLRDAHSSVEARQAAEQRVAELEHSLQAVNTRTQRMLDDLGSKWHAAEAAERQVRQELSRAMSSLAVEEQARVTAQQVAVHAIREHRQMAAALEAERLIKCRVCLPACSEPLRHTHHASTTMAHVMRSQAAPLVADRSRHPSTPGQNRRMRAACHLHCRRKHIPSIGQAPGCCPSGPKTAVFTAETPRAVRPASPVTYNRVTSRPDAPSAVGGQKLHCCIATLDMKPSIPSFGNSWLQDLATTVLTKLKDAATSLLAPQKAGQHVPPNLPNNGTAQQADLLARVVPQLQASPQLQRCLGQHLRVSAPLSHTTLFTSVNGQPSHCQQVVVEVAGSGGRTAMAQVKLISDVMGRQEVEVRVQLPQGDTITLPLTPGPDLAQPKRHSGARTVDAEFKQV